MFHGAPPSLAPRRVLAFAHDAVKFEPDSRLRVLIRGEEWRGWGRPEQMMADLIDRTTALAFASNGVRDEPPRYPRPGAKTVKPKAISVAQMNFTPN